MLALTGEIAAKRLSLLHELLPHVRTVGYLNNRFATVASEEEFSAAFAAIGRLRAEALFISADTLFLNQRERVVNACCPKPDTGHLRVARLRCYRRPHQLRAAPARFLPASRHLRGTHPEGGKAGSFTAVCPKPAMSRAVTWRCTWGFAIPMLIGTGGGLVSFVITLFLSLETKGKVLMADLQSAPNV